MAIAWHPTVARPMAATSVSWSMVEWQVMVYPQGLPVGGRGLV